MSVRVHSGKQAPVCILRDKGLSTESAAFAPVGRVRRGCCCRSGRLAGPRAGPQSRLHSVGFHQWPVYTAGRGRLSGPGLGSHCQPPWGSCPLLHFCLFLGQTASSHARWMHRDVALASAGSLRAGSLAYPLLLCSHGDPLPPQPTWHAPRRFWLCPLSRCLWPSSHLGLSGTWPWAWSQSPNVMHVYFPFSFYRLLWCLVHQALYLSDLGP